MKTFKNILPLSFFLLILISWESIPFIFSIPDYIFPRLSDIIPSIIKSKTAFLENSITTFHEAILGFLLGSFIGFITGLFMAQSKLFAKTILPYVVASNAIPIVAIAPLVIIWFGHGITSKVILAAFLCFFPLAINTFKGLNEFSSIYKELFYTYGATNTEFLIKFKIRNAVPFIFAGLKLNATYSVIGAIVAEFIGATSGLGFGMLQASYNLNTPRLFGYIFVACSMGLGMYYLIVLIEKLTLKNKII
jgi:NitT/TauT family transport system permease protein